MIQVRDVLGRARPLAVAAVFTAAAFLPIVATHFASAGVVSDRSLLVTSSRPSGVAGSSTTPGDPTNGNGVGHTYTFTPSTSGSVSSIHFKVYTDAFGYLTGGPAPSGFAMSNSPDFGDVTITGASGFDGLTRVAAAEWAITSTGGATLTSGTPVTVVFAPTAATSFSNPNAGYLAGAQGGTFFVRISTQNVTAAFDNNDPGKVIDEGTVTSAVSNTIDIETRIKETLKFSVKADERNAGGSTGMGLTGLAGPTDPSTTCAALTGTTALRIGDPTEYTLSAANTYNGFSYFRIATNSARGTVVYYAGDTLKSGTESIPAVGAGAVGPATNSEQFGMTLANSADDRGITNLTALNELQPALGTGFTAINQYAFDDASIGNPQPLAESTSTISCDTAAIEYIANIAEDTPAGIYTTKITYIASPSY